MALKALIWDVDGTLAETELVHLEAFNRAFRNAGLPWRWSRELYGELLGVAGGRERIAAFLARSRPPLGPHEQAHALAARLHLAKNELYRSILSRGGVALRPGVSRLLGEAKSTGLIQAVCTTSGRDNVLPLLDSLVPGGSGFFDCIVTGNEVLRKKPDPEAYEAVLGLLGLEPGECLAVEDSENGVRAAAAAGIHAVATPGMFSRRDYFGLALAVTSHLGEPGNPCIVSRAPSPCAEGLVNVGVLERWCTAAVEIA